MDLHYEVHGSGKPVVLVHSGGADMRDWGFLVPSLSENFYVIAFDGRGAGRSPSPVQPPNFVEDLLSLLDHLNISQAAVIGHSMGGRIATEFIIHYPENACSKRERLQDISVNTLFIIGDHELPDNQQVGEQFRRVPNVRFTTIAGADHMVTLTHPEELSRDITPFVKE